MHHRVRGEGHGSRTGTRADMRESTYQSTPVGRYIVPRRGYRNTPQHVHTTHAVTFQGHSQQPSMQQIHTRHRTSQPRTYTLGADRKEHRAQERTKRSDNPKDPIGGPNPPPCPSAQNINPPHPRPSYAGMNITYTPGPLSGPHHHLRR